MNIDEELARLAELGKHAPYVDDKPTVDEVLRGISKDGGLWSLKVLLGGYLESKSRVGFAEGDTVKVRKPFIASLCTQGWAGYQAMFHDSVATVVEVRFSPVHRRWIVDIRYEVPYYYAPRNQDFVLYVKTHPNIFMMWPEHLKHAK